MDATGTLYAVNFLTSTFPKARFTQGVSVLANDETTLNSETALTVAINSHFSLKVAYDVTYNTKPPASAPDKTDTVTSVNLVYGM